MVSGQSQASSLRVVFIVAWGAITGALPTTPHYPERAKQNCLIADVVDEVLDEDRRAPFEQRRTAGPIHRRTPRQPRCRSRLFDAV